MKLLRSKLQGQVLQEIELIDGSEYLIGRSSSCDLCLTKSREISRQHVKILQNEEGRWVAQLISRSGDLIYHGKNTNQIVLDDSLSFHLSPYEIEFSVEVPIPAQSPIPTEPNAHALQPLSPTPHAIVDNGEGMDEEITADGIAQLIAYLEILWTDKSTESITLKGDSWTIGRDNSSNIIIPKPYISRKQFEITKKNDEFYISDLGSSNGTSLNDTPLQPHQPQPLGSHDIISTKKIKIRFLIKNQTLEVQDNHRDSHPLVPTTENIPMGESHRNVIRISSKDSLLSNPRKKAIYFAIAACVILIIYGLIGNDKKTPLPSETNVASVTTDGSIAHLPKEQQMIIKDTFNLARTHYTQGNYELCLSEVKKLHKRLPFYENSKEIESLCEQGRILIIKQEEKERRQQNERELKEKVNVIIRKCKAKINSRTTLTQVEACLSPARESDPSHPQIDKLITQIKIRDKKRADNLKRRAAYQAKVQRGIQKYKAAKRVYQKKSLSSAIKAYQEYLRSSFPDPQKLKSKARRELASIKGIFNQKMNKKISSCKDSLDKRKYKQAIYYCNEAIAEDSSNKKAENLRSQALSQLREKMKLIYDDATLEEQFGNIDAAKEKWSQILNEDIPSDEYFKRAKRKMQKYGDGI